MKHLIAAHFTGLIAGISYVTADSLAVGMAWTFVLTTLITTVIMWGVFLFGGKSV